MGENYFQTSEKGEWSMKYPSLPHAHDGQADLEPIESRLLLFSIGIQMIIVSVQTLIKQ